MASEVDVLALHVVGPRIQPEILIEDFMFLGGNLYFAIALQQHLNERVLVLQFAHLPLEGGIFLIGGCQLQDHIAVALIVFF